MRNIKKGLFTLLPMFFILLLFNINEIESLHVEMYQYILGNRGIIFIIFHVLLIVISPCNVL